MMNSNIINHKCDFNVRAENPSTIPEFNLRGHRSDNNILYSSSARGNNDMVSPFSFLITAPQGPALATPFMDIAQAPPPPTLPSLCTDMEYFMLSRTGETTEPTQNDLPERVEIKWAPKTLQHERAPTFNFVPSENPFSPITQKMATLTLDSTLDFTTNDVKRGDSNFMAHKYRFQGYYPKGPKYEYGNSSNAMQNVSPLQSLSVSPQCPYTLFSSSSSSSSSASASPGIITSPTNISLSSSPTQYKNSPPAMSMQQQIAQLNQTLSIINQNQNQNQSLTIMNQNQYKNESKRDNNRRRRRRKNRKRSAQQQQQQYQHEPKDPNAIPFDETLPFEHYIGHIYSLSQEQAGCRYLQKKLEEEEEEEEENEEEKEQQQQQEEKKKGVFNAIYAEILPHASQVMADPFGNYLFQKLLKRCSGEQRRAILDRVCGDLVAISMSVQGTRSVQKVIDYVRTEEEIAIVEREFRGNLVRMIQDLNSNHVVQRCIRTFQSPGNQFIYDELTEDENMVRVATHRHSCCVIQRCIDLGTPAQKRQIVDSVVRHVATFVEDQYGNYVVQYVVGLNIAGVSRRIATLLRGRFAELSMQKFSSNVVEKLMQADAATDPGDAVEVVVDEIVGCETVDALLQDPFANYVVQTALSRASEAQRKVLSDLIACRAPVLKNSPYGKRILAKVHKDSHPNTTSRK